MNKKTKEPVFEVVSPLGQSTTKTIGLAPRAHTLDGKTVCEVSNYDFEADETFPMIREMLRERYPNIKVIPYNEMPRMIVPELAGANMAETIATLRAALLEKSCDAVIAGNGG